MNLKDIMSPIDTFFGPGESLINVAKSLAEKHHSCGLICEYDKAIGIITERPICVDAELAEALDLAKSQSRSLYILAIEDTAIASKRICETISQKNYIHEHSPFGHLTVSIGAASGATDNWELIIERADSALYDAKDAGRNTVRSIAPAEDSGFWDLGKRIERDDPGTGRRRSDHDGSHD